MADIGQVLEVGWVSVPERLRVTAAAGVPAHCAGHANREMQGGLATPSLGTSGGSTMGRPELTVLRGSDRMGWDSARHFLFSAAPGGRLAAPDMA
jgi:hypothetical protein